jgi:hypothetical protein
MDRDELIARVHELRTEGLPPKAVARALGLTPAQVKPLIRAAAAMHEVDVDARPVVSCMVNPDWSIGLSWDGHPEWVDNESDPSKSGFACVLLARQYKWGRVRVCGYLVDLYCLGVKNTIGPKLMTDQEFAEFTTQFFAPYALGPIDIPLELAQELVFGAVEYARGLGFEPHPDFAGAADHLGPWTGPSAITFGKDGAPLYIEGPYDDAAKVMATLQQSVGKGNFDFAVEVAGPGS